MQRILIIDLPDTTDTALIDDAVRAAVRSAGGTVTPGVWVGIVTDREQVLDREEGRTFLEAWGATYDECAARLHVAVAGYVREQASYAEEGSDQDLLRRGSVQAWLDLVDAGRFAQADELFRKEELFDTVDFHWDTRQLT